MDHLDARLFGLTIEFTYTIRLYDLPIVFAISFEHGAKRTFNKGFVILALINR